jgi:hypothetical protein
MITNSEDVKVADAKMTIDRKMRITSSATNKTVSTIQNCTGTIDDSELNDTANMKEDSDSIFIIIR